MKILVLSSRTGKALAMLNELDPIHSAVTRGTTPLGINYYPEPKNITEWKALEAMRFDLALSLGFMHHIPKELYEHTPTLNVHPGKLPVFKGKDPHLQALKSGTEYTAVTIHKVTEELDSGEILVEVPVKIHRFEDSASKLEERLRLVAVYATAALLHGLDDLFLTRWFH